MIRFLILFCLSATTCFAQELSERNFNELRDLIHPSEKELEYTKLQWHTNMGLAINEARSKNKPILLWAYNGNPFGCGCYNAIVTRNVFGDKQAQTLCKDFVLVADCSWRLDVENKYPGHEFFRKAYPKGGQGVYVLTPSGKMIDRCAGEWGVMNCLQQSIQKWNDLPSQEKTSVSKVGGGTKPEDKLYPHNGLVLHAYMRDLPHYTVKPDGPQWNQDFAWFTKEEARQFLPPVIKPDKTHDVPKFIAHRLIRFYFVDSVHGGTTAYQEKDVKISKLSVNVISVEKGLAKIEIKGESRTEEEGNWCVKEDTKPSPQKRGFAAKIIGKAEYNLAQQKFVSFEMLACGTRWGATECNFRTNLGESPMGVLLVLAGKEPGEKIKPMFLDQYNDQVAKMLSR